MPPKKIIKKQVITEDFSDNDSDSPIMSPIAASIAAPSSTPSVVGSTKSMPTRCIQSSTKDPERIQLIHAINNFTVKGEQLVAAMKSFDVFQEHIDKLDILINAKKIEHDDIMVHLEKTQKLKLTELESHYKEVTKKLESEHSELKKTNDIKYTDATRKLEMDYAEKSKHLQNELKNDQILIKQKLAEFKLKACDEVAKEINMVVIKSDEYTNLQQLLTKTSTELNDLKKSFDKECDKIRGEEKGKYNTHLENEKKMLKMASDVINADIKAQTEQQIKEIAVLKEQIANLKHELTEQRTLTKDVAQASSKSQISQNFSKP